MSARQNVRARMRVLNAEYSRLMHLRQVTALGFGINRVPILKRDGSPIVRVITDGAWVAQPTASLFGGGDIFSHLGQAERRRHQRKEPPTAILTQIDMRHYWQICAEKRRLEIKLNLEPENLRRWVPGWVPEWAPEHRKPMWGGPERFRTPIGKTETGRQVIELPGMNIIYC